MNPQPVPDAQDLDQPFPLKRMFLRRFAPAFVGFFVFSLILVGFNAGKVVESIYLELAQRRAQTIARAVAEHAPIAWRELMSGRTVRELSAQSDTDALLAAFQDEVRELRLSELKIYNLERRVLFATHPEEIGTMENGEALRNVIGKAAPAIVVKTNSDGTKQYELYVPVFNDRGKVRSVFELYEPVGQLDEILTSAAIPSIAIPGLLLFVLAAALNNLVNRAQTSIDSRTRTINELRKRIESFVSSTAVDAAKSVDAAGDIRSLNVTTTLFFSDIRDFTGFAEHNAPEVVVGFLNQIMTLQVDILKRHNGDVDKMIGDAVLARFDGEGGSARALAAAREIIDSVKLGDFPRALGIGIYRGEVISGVIGPEDRRDFTVIGHSVNMAARLCSAAGADEIVVEAELAGDEFEPAEFIQVKGRQKPLAVRRWRA